MPEIRQYTQQVNPVGPTDVQKATGEDFGSGVGEATRTLGGTMAAATDYIHSAVKRKEASDLDVATSNANQQLGIQLSDQIQKGTLDRDKFMESVSNTLDAVSEKVVTNDGQNMFNREKARAQLMFSQAANQAQAKLAGDKAIANWKGAVDADTSSLQNNPAMFQTLLQKRYDAIDDQVATKGLPAAHADQLKLDSGTSYAESAIRGTARMSATLAQQQLDSGMYDKYLPGNGKYKMQLEIDHYKNGERVQAERLQKLADDEAKAKEEAITNKWYDMLYSNGLSTKDVMFSPESKDVSLESKIKFNAMIEKRQNSDDAPNNKQVIRDTMADMLKTYDDPSRTIRSRDDIDRLYINGQINQEGLKFLQGQFKNGASETEENEKVLQKGVWDAAKNAILKPDKMTGLSDPVAAANFQSWQMDAVKRIQNAKKDGTFSNDFFDPKSPKYIGNNFQQYQRSMDDIIKDNVARISKTSPTGEEMVSAVKPDGTPVRLPKSKVDAARKAGAIK